MEARIFQQAISRAAPTYAVPYVFGVTLLFAVVCLGGALLAADWMRILLAVIGSFATLFAAGVMGYTVIARPEMLRSERHVERMLMAQMIGDKEMTPSLREQLSHAVLDAADQPRPKNASDQTALSNENGNNGNG